MDSLAREWGVSRAEVLRQCGDIKSEEELENERKLLQLEKFEERVQKAGFIKKESHLEQQIKEAEQRAEVLSDYERMRLENMRERQALLEELDIDKERKEIAEEKQRGMIFTPKHEIKRRAPSARLKTLREKERLLKEDTGRYWTPQESQVSPRWVGQWLSVGGYVGEKQKFLIPKFSSEDRTFHVPRSELSLMEISTQGKGPDSKNSLLEYIAAELEEVVTDQPAYKSMNGTLAQSKLVRESLVVTSTITELASCWDFVGFGTEEGEVGVQVGSAHLSWQPHTGTVTGVAFDGGVNSLGLLSSSLDGAFRRSDLSRQAVVLEHIEEQSSISCLLKKGPGLFLLSCGSAVKLFDLRMKSAGIIVDMWESGGLGEGSKMTLHPTKPHQVAIPQKKNTHIFDLRQSKDALFSLPGSFSSLQWSPDFGEHILITGRPIQTTSCYRLDMDAVEHNVAQGWVHKTSLLMKGVDQPLLRQRLSDPQAVQWSPWSLDQGHIAPL